MIWQYMVKTADVGIRAKDALVRLIATKQSTAVQRGEKAFGEGGCGGCHVIGKVSSGPDLTGVLERHGKDSAKWVADFIKAPEKMYKDPYVDAMINSFNLKMPNQHMTDEDIKNIIEYFKWVDENANLF
jgi:nitrous-oxide reductase